MPDSTMARRRSLRKRLMWAFTSLTTLSVLVLAIALFWASEEQEEDLIDEVVNTALDGITARPIDSEPVALGRHLSLFQAPVGRVPAGLPPALHDLPIGNHEWYSDETEFHVGIRDHDGQRFYLLYDATEHEERIAFLLWVLVVGGLAISLASLWLGYWISGLLLHQLEQLASQVVEDDSSPLAKPDQDREVALLAQALDDYRTRNAALIAREREFTANVSHELRTPLTRIRTSAELLADGMLDANRARRIVLAVDELEKRLQGLLFLARGTAPAQVASLDLHRLIGDLAEPYRADCQARGLVMENRIPPACLIEADPALLSLLVDNLLRNAVRYTEAGRILVTYEAGWLAVRDTGVGIPADKLEQVFDRHFRISDLPDGMGLGLSIVQGIAQRCGWPCELHSELGQGTEVRIHLAS